MTDTLEYKGVKIRYLGHSGFIIAKGEYSIVLDPFLTGAPMAVMKPSDIKASDILLTHGHQDHLGDAVEISKNNQAKITAVMELAEYCTEQGAETIRVPIGGTWQYPWGSAQFRYAMHSGFLPDGRPFGQAASILLNIGGVKIYDLGDTALQQDFKLVGEIYKPDIAFVPIGGRANMNINEALALSYRFIMTFIRKAASTRLNLKANWKARPTFSAWSCGLRRIRSGAGTGYFYEAFILCTYFSLPEDIFYSLYKKRFAFRLYADFRRPD